MPLQDEELVEMRRMACALALAASLAGVAVSAQETGRVLFALDAHDASAAETYALSLASSLASSPVFVGVMRASDPDSFAAEAGRLGYDLALSARVEKIIAGVRVSWRIVGTRAGEDLGAGSFDAAEPGDKELAEYFWADLVTAAEDAFAASGPRANARLVVKGPPGALVTGLGGDPLTLPPDGEIEIDAKAPGTLAWSASAKGYYGGGGVVELFGSRSELMIDLQRQHLWTIELGLLNGAFPDLWASRRFLDDRLFARFGLYQFVAGFALGDIGPGYDPKFLVSLSLLQPGIGAGWIFGKPGAAIRPYTGLSATTRIAFPKGAGIFIDPVAPISLEPYAGVEWKALLRFGFFAEMGIALYPFAQRNLILASVGNSKKSVLYASGSNWFLQFPSLRFGSRFYL
jgi:hypothetical protein